MKRTARDNRPNLKPVEKVELSGKNLVLRIIMVCIFIIIAMVSFGYGINQFFSANKGWHEIEASKSEDGNCGDEFIFQYNLGVSGVDATAEKKKLSSVYSELSEHAYQVFCSDKGFSNCSNLYQLNKHPNEKIKVDEVLYQALERLNQYGNRMIFMAPIYESYDDIFYCNTQEEASYYDPEQNGEMYQWNQEILSLISKEENISIELLGNNQVILNVSEEYMAYAKEEEITTYVDFMWMKNAFIIDYMADSLIEKGYSKGILSSFDGYTRSLSDLGEYGFNLYAKEKEWIYQAGVFQYEDKISLVNLKAYPVNSKEEYRYFSNGKNEYFTPYLSMETGSCMTSKNEMICYSREKECSEILLSMIPYFITTDFKKDCVFELKENQIETIYMEDTAICYTEDGIFISDLYENEDREYLLYFIAK